MKSFKSVLVGTFMTGLVAAAPSHVADEEPWGPPSEVYDGQIMWALIRTRSVLDDGTIKPLNVWAPVSDDEGITIANPVHMPIRDVAIVRFQPLDLENYDDYNFNDYGCYTYGDELGDPVYFDLDVVYLGGDGGQQFELLDFSCGRLRDYESSEAPSCGGPIDDNGHDPCH